MFFDQYASTLAHSMAQPSVVQKARDLPGEIGYKVRSGIERGLLAGSARFSQVESDDGQAQRHIFHRFDHCTVLIQSIAGFRTEADIGCAQIAPDLPVIRPACKMNIPIKIQHVGELLERLQLTTIAQYCQEYIIVSNGIYQFMKRVQRVFNSVLDFHSSQIDE